MAIDTFEAENKNKLETYEWDDMWWDNSGEEDTHILVIGDSISRGYRHILKEVTGGRWRIDNFASSKAVDNDFFKKALDTAISQQEKYDLILFNNGLHGWHLSSDEYGEHYMSVLQHLMSKNIRMAVILTTPWLDERNRLVKERNERAISCAEKMGVPVIDVYSLIEGHEELYGLPDTIHLKKEGYKKLAEHIYKSAKEILGK